MRGATDLLQPEQPHVEQFENLLELYVGELADEQPLECGVDLRRFGMAGRFS
jgi:hypothetical protein